MSHSTYRSVVALTASSIAHVSAYDVIQHSNVMSVAPITPKMMKSINEKTQSAHLGNRPYNVATSLGGQKFPRGGDPALQYEKY